MMKQTNFLAVGATGSTKSAKPEAQGFNFIFAVSFLIFLVIVVIARFLPRQWRIWLPQPDKPMSVISEAKAAVNTFIPFAFMA